MSIFIFLAYFASENEDRLCLCCGMLQNVCVTSPKDVQKFEESFSQIAALLLQIFTSENFHCTCCGSCYCYSCCCYVPVCIKVSHITFI